MKSRANCVTFLRKKCQLLLSSLYLREVGESITIMNKFMLNFWWKCPFRGPLSPQKIVFTKYLYVCVCLWMDLCIAKVNTNGMILITFGTWASRVPVSIYQREGDSFRRHRLLRVRSSTVSSGTDKQDLSLERR